MEGYRLTGVLINPVRIWNPDRVEGIEKAKIN
jgi:hypothetical protein